jgi:hypothetical protein
MSSCAAFRSSAVMCPSSLPGRTVCHSGSIAREHLRHGFNHVVLAELVVDEDQHAPFAGEFDVTEQVRAVQDADLPFRPDRAVDEVQREHDAFFAVQRIVRGGCALHEIVKFVERVFAENAHSDRVRVSVIRENRVVLNDGLARRNRFRGRFWIPGFGRRIRHLIHGRFGK